MPNLETLSANKLNEEIEKRRAADGVGLDALIAAGYGNTTGNELDSMVKAGKASKLVCDARKASHAYHEALDEQSRRMRWHGSEKPIKKRPIY